MVERNATTMGSLLSGDTTVVQDLTSLYDVTLDPFYVTLGMTTGSVEEGESITLSIRDAAMKIIYIVISTLGLVGNAMVVAILLGFKSLRKKMTNVFIVNQSILDFLTATTLLLTTLIEYDGRYLSGLADEIYCRMWLGKVPLWSFLMSSSYNLVALTLERYFKVVYPIKHKVSFTPFKAGVILALVWIVGPLFNVAYDVATSRVENGRCRMLEIWPSRSAHQAAGVIAFVLQYFIPIGILAFCYSHMAYSLQRRITAVSGGAGHTVPQPGNGGEQEVARPGQQQTSKLMKGRKNIIKTLALVSTAFLLCLSWNQWVFLLFNLGVLDYRAFDTVFYHFSVVAMFLNCCVNPFIYTAKYQAFQAALKKIFCAGKVSPFAIEQSVSKTQQDTTGTSA